MICRDNAIGIVSFVSTSEFRKSIFLLLIEGNNNYMHDVHVKFY